MAKVYYSVEKDIDGYVPKAHLWIPKRANVDPCSVDSVNLSEGKIGIKIHLVVDKEDFKEKVVCLPSRLSKEIAKAVNELSTYEQQQILEHIQVFKKHK